MLSRIAREHAAEIAKHDWTDAPYRADRAGHQRTVDSNRGANTLSDSEADIVKLNVMWVTAQVLMHADPNLPLGEFAAACGLPTSILLNNDGRPSGSIPAGIRHNSDGSVSAPGTSQEIR